MSDYLQQLNLLRFWNRLGIFLLVAFLPIGALILALGHYFRILGLSLIVVFFAPWVVLMATAYYRIRTFRCPKCGKFLQLNMFWHPTVVAASAFTVDLSCMKQPAVSPNQLIKATATRTAFTFFDD